VCRVCGVCGMCGMCGVCGVTFDIPQTALVATLDTYDFYFISNSNSILTPFFKKSYLNLSTDYTYKFLGI
jgi:hypothetical protein